MRHLLVGLLTLITAGASLVGPSNVSAKGGGPWPQTFRISGGGLSHPVLIPTADILLATAVSGSWYVEPDGLSEPASDMPRYQVEIVDARDTSQPIEAPKPYVIGPPARIGAQDGPGWGQPTPAIAALLNRYIALGDAGSLLDGASFSDVVAASASLFGVAVTVDKQPVSSTVAEQVLKQVGKMTPSLFGVQGTLVGSRNLHLAALNIAFGDSDADRLAIDYVPPGPVAPYGLLFAGGTTTSWGYVTILDPPGYFATVYPVTPEFDQLMSALGFVGQPEGDIGSNRLIPLDSARQTFGIDRYELSFKGKRAVVSPPPQPVSDSEVIAPPCSDSACTRYLPQEPFSGSSMDGEVWPLPVDPFPDALRPGKFVYYAHDALGSERGVIVQTEGSAELNGTNGAQDPYFADPALDALFKEQLNRFEHPPSKHRLAKTLATGIPAVTAGALAMVYVAWSAERRRRAGLT